MAKRGSKRVFGSADKLPTGEWRARFTGPDGLLRTAKGPDGKGLRFSTKADADAWLARERTRILDGAWKPPAASVEPALTFRAYSETWLSQRGVAARTHDDYRHLLDKHLLPTFGDLALVSITPGMVREWHAGLDSSKPTMRAHAYGLLRTMLGTAVTDELLLANPCRIRGAGRAKRARDIQPASLQELAALVQAVPARYEAMVLMAAWCALRFGELTELRRSDVEIREVPVEGGDPVKVATVRISRGVVRTKSAGKLVKGPKTETGIRTVAIPPHLIPVLEDHLDKHVAPGKTALLFPSAHEPGEHMTHSTLNKVWLKARVTAGRPDLAFHDLRHTGAVLAAQTGATLAELMARLGHSSPQAAMRYQHAAKDRDRAIADALSVLANATPGAA